MVNTILKGSNVLKAEKQILVVKPSIEKNTCKLRVAAYARVSSNSEDQLNSFSAQVRYYRQTIAEDERNILVDIYSDEGITGTSVEKRDDFNRLLKDCRQGKIDRIITKSISRFSRNTLDSISIVRELWSLGISVYFEKEKMDTGLMSGEMLFTLYSAVAQQESKSISENCKISIRFRMRNGTYVSSNPPYGYRLVNKELEIYEPEAKIVQMIFTNYLNGMGANAIAKQLNNLGIKNKAGTVKWRYQTINGMLKNERYIGDMRLQKSYTEDALPFKAHINKGEFEQFYVKSSHDGIIDERKFELVGALLNYNGLKINGIKEEHILSKTIICEECGTLYKRRTISNGYYWVCREHNESKAYCSSSIIAENKIYNAFIHMYNKLKANKNILIEMQKRLEKLRELELQDREDLRSLNIKIAEIAEQNQTMSRLMSQGILDSALFLSNQDGLKKQLAEMKSAKQRVLDSLKADQVLENTKNLLCDLEDGPEYITKMDEELFKNIVEKIYAYDNESVKFQLVNGLVLTERLV